nr:putative lysine-specific demethylase JMJ16 isoform X1 [Tanacetum cinerariifolium]
MMTSKDLGSRKKAGDEPSAPPGFVSLTSLTLKRKRDRQPEQNEAYSKTTDIEKLQKSFKQRPWILNDQLTNLEKPNMQHLNPNISVENSLPKGVIQGCRPPSVVYTTVFHPTEEEFKDIYKYIDKIRPKAEENGICRINPPKSWEPPFLMKGNKFDTKFGTHVQEINALKDLHSKRKLNEIIEQKDGSDGFEFESGPEFTLPAFKRYAEQFKQKYFKKPDMFTGVGTPPWESVEGEYWRIIQNPTEEIQVLSGHNLEAKVLGSGFPLPTPDDHNDNQSKYRKSSWNLNNTPKMPGSLLAFDSDNSTLLTPRMDVGMCFSSFCWKVEEHHLYLLSYMHHGSSRIWYGVTQLSPSILKSEGIPVYRCVQNPKQFILIFPGAYHAGFDTGFSVSEKANFALLDWLPHGQLTVETYSEMHRKTCISYDKLLLEGTREAAKSWDSKTRGWNNGCRKDGWLTRALKSRVRLESFKRESLCNGSQSPEMEEDFGCSVKRVFPMLY